MTSVQLGLRGGRRVDRIYDFSGGLLTQDAAPGQRVGSNPPWPPAKETLFSFIFLILSIPRCGFTVSEGERAVPDSGLLLHLKSL